MMKIEIEIPQDAMESALLRAAKNLIAVDSWSPGKLTGDMAADLTQEIRSQIRLHIQSIDLTAEINAVVAERAVPSIRDAIKRELAAEAKKAVKAALDKNEVTT
jgi:hypothetical protein